MAYYSDIDMTLEKDQTGDVRKNEDLEAVKSSIYNIVSTIQEHRVMLPEFAENGYNMLFEPVDPDLGENLGSILWDSIEKGDNRVKLHNINIDVNYYDQEYNVSITFSVENLSIELDSTTTIFVVMRRIE